MENRGRISEIEREVSNLITPAFEAKPEPPAHLSEAEAAEWRAIVGRMPHGWFRQEHYGLLEALCCHTCQSREVNAKLAETSIDDLAQYSRLSIIASRASRDMAQCMTKLRLTHQSQYDEKFAHKSASRPASRPWGPK